MGQIPIPEKCRRVDNEERDEIVRLLQQLATLRIQGRGARLIDTGASH